MPNSLKDMASSVDWKKMLSSQDAKNALIGSALGGLVLGGAGLMADRDPEESKLSPVGDALMGALLGGVAGYGIPKGLAMFRDAGSLAPNGDSIKSNYLGWGAGGAGVGAAAFGLGSLRKTLSDVAAARGEIAAKNRITGLRDAISGLREAMRNGMSNDVLDYYKRQISMFSGGPGTANARITAVNDILRRADPHATLIGTDANAVLDDLRRRRFDLLRQGRRTEARAVADELKNLKRMRNYTTKGYSSFGDLLRFTGEAGNEINNAGARPGRLDMLLHPKKWWGNFNSAGHYHTGRAFGFGPRLPAWSRMAKRTGKYALGGTAAAMLLHKLFGPSSSDNFKK